MRVIIDGSGEVNLDLIGYLGEACQAEEEKLRRTLASLGLRVEIGQLRAKNLQEQMEEASQLSQQSRQPEPAARSANRPEVKP